MLGRAAFRIVVSALVIATLVACGGAGATPSPSPSTSPSAKAIPITKIEMSGSLATDGSAASPTATFNSSRDQQIIAVLTLANLDAGTKISYTRSIDAKYVNSKTAVLKKRSKYFHFTFKPKTGATFKPGSYRLKFYVNEKAAGEISFLVK